VTVQGALNSVERPQAMLHALRDATRQAHQVLEDRLDLLSAAQSPMRLGQVLARFERFHRDWEPRIEALIGRPTLLVPRRRLTLLQADLAALGVARDRDPGPDLSWLDGPDAAWGSLYVLEGSTLGGQVIAKALTTESGRSASDLSYFISRGPRTAAFWRETTEAIEAYAPVGDRDQILAGAVRTFEMLPGWLAPAVSAAV